MKSVTCIPFLPLQKTISISVFVFCGIFNAFSQKDHSLEYYFETDTISVVQGQTFLNFLVLKNSGTSDITITDIQPDEKYPGLLLSPEARYTLLSGEKKTIPIKFLANTDFMKLKSQNIIFHVSYAQDMHIMDVRTSFSIHRKEEKQIALYSFSRENHIIPSQAESNVSLFVENRGFSPRSIKLVFQATPVGLDIKPKELILSLEGQEKRMIEFKVSVRPQEEFYPDYNIQVRAIDLTDNENVGNTYLKLIVLTNNRQIGRSADPEMGKNYAEIAYNEQSSGFNYLQFKGNTEFSPAKNTQGRFNLAADYYFSESQYNLYDTWLELERKNTLLRLGNVYANDYDYSVSGRGGLLNTKIGENNTIEILALENNYNLYGTYFPESAGSKLAGAKYIFGVHSKFNGKISYIFDHNSRLQTNTHVANLVSSFAWNTIHNFRLEVGASQERGLINEDENSGASVGLNYDVRLGNWDLQSLNNISSKNYAGLSRGSFNLYQNLGYKLSQSLRLFLLYQNSQIQPEYLSRQQNGHLEGNAFYPFYFYSMESIKAGTQFSIGNWNFLLSPSIEKQKSANNSFDQELFSYGLKGNIGTAFNGHHLDLMGEYFYSSTPDLSWFHSIRTILSYRFRGFSVNGSAQYNPNNVIDLNYYALGNKDFFNYNLYAAYNFQTRKQTVSGSVSMGINYSELYNNTNKTFNGNLEYKVSRSWSATGYGNYSEYKSTLNYGFKGDNYQFRIGIKKHFIRPTAAGNHKVSLQLFHDTNSNGIFDNNEKAIANESVKLDEFVAISDKTGKVTFQNVPFGTYTLKINEITGLRMLTDQNILVDQNKNLKIGLIKKNKITGRLVEIKQAYDKLETYVRGVIVYAKDEEGNTISTLVNQNNEFEFFLPNGGYLVYIENDNYQYIDSSKKIIVDNADPSTPLIFEYTKKDTEIKVKKF